MEQNQEEHIIIPDKYRGSRMFYIIEAALEYFISIMVGGAYLAKITAYIGLSDRLTGILTSFVSLGCGFQIVALLLANKKPVKRWVSFGHTVGFLSFSCLYLVPVVPLSKELKTAIFVASLVLGHAIGNIVNSPKINWFMSLVDPHGRGLFTAKKEIISLLGGMVFSYALGAMIDHYEGKGDIETAFILGAAGLVILTVLHLFTLIFSKEKPEEKKEGASVAENLKKLFRNRAVLKIIILKCLWGIAVYCSTPFYGSYQIKELGFSMTFVAVLGIVYAVARSLGSPVLGKYADKNNFIRMLRICYVIALVGFGINIFTMPSNGKVFYTVYYVLYGVSLAGINSGAINLIYENVEPDQRMSAYALQQSIVGVVGFLTTLAVSPLVDYIQKNGGIFGLSVYAQQVMSALATVFILIVLAYVRLFLMPKKENTGKCHENR